MNNIKITLLLGALTGLVVGIGYYFGGQSGALIALLISAFMNFTSYWFSDRIVLSMYRAKEMNEVEHERVHRMVEELSRNAGLPKPKLYIVDLPVPNAFATGRNENNSVVAVSPAILEMLEDEELRGVLAHELGHIKNKDILISTIAATLAGTISYMAQIVYFNGGNREGRNNVFGIIAMTVVTPLLAGMLRMAISRSREYLADETGAKMASDSNGLSNALKKLHLYSAENKVIAEPRHEATAHMFIINPFKASTLLSLFSTHPPMEERIRRLNRVIIN